MRKKELGRLLDYDKEFSIQLGKHIRALRLMKGWTQEKLAEEADLSATFISRIELGKASASFVNLLKISQAFGFNHPETLYQDIANRIYKSMTKDKNK
jgi:transcriptional regulator with XRE-family HTH domain